MARQADDLRETISAIAMAHFRDGGATFECMQDAADFIAFAIRSTDRPLIPR